MEKRALIEESGFTFLEILVVLVIFVVVFTSTSSLYKRGLDSWRIVEESSTIQQSARTSFMKITDLVRQYDKEHIRVVDRGRGLYVGENWEYYIKLLNENNTLYFDSLNHPIALNITDLGFTLKEVSYKGGGVKLQEVSNDCNWDLLKIELIAGNDEREQKLKTYIYFE